MTSRVLVGPHYRFELATELRSCRDLGVWHAEMPEIGLHAIGDTPAEPEADVIAALGGAVCELWCVLVCVAQDDHREWTALLTHHEREQAIALVDSLVGVEALGAPHLGASHGMATPAGSGRWNRAALRALSQELQGRLSGPGIFGSKPR